jgi:hypothetical protein
VKKKLLEVDFLSSSCHFTSDERIDREPGRTITISHVKNGARMCSENNEFLIFLKQQRIHATTR